MCGRYVLVQKVEVLQERFNVQAAPDFHFEPSYNISPGNSAPVITMQEPHLLQLFTFGLTPFWAKKAMYLFNARAEGSRNRENNPNYKGAKDIINKPAFRKAIRSQRCLIPADAFIEGTVNEGLSKPFLVYLANKRRPFSFAGIYDVWKNPVNGMPLHSFAIITTTANELMQSLPHHRSPVILNPSQEKYWLNPKTRLTDITTMLKPYPSELMNAYPISPEIKNPKNKHAGLIKPLGPHLQDRLRIKTVQQLKLQGMGSTKKNSTQE